MSWSDRLLRVAAAAALAAAAGCGFRPLYGDADGAAVVAALAAVEVRPIEGPLGFEMRNRLLDELAPRSLDDARYALSVDVATVASAQVTEQDAQIRRFLLNLDADYVLVSKADGRRLTGGRASAETSYNTVAHGNVSTLVAEQKAMKDVARSVSRQIVTRLAFYFDRRGAP